MVVVVVVLVVAVRMRRLVTRPSPMHRTCASEEATVPTEAMLDMDMEMEMADLVEAAGEEEGASHPTTDRP